MPEVAQPERRFWRFVHLTDDCWLWTGSQTNGYGRFRVNKSTLYAHRFSYEMFVGRVPEGLELDHLCRNHSCVRPDHLEAVTHLENSRRGLKGVLTTHCPQGHPYEGDNLKIWRGKRYCLACHAETRRRRRSA